LAPRAPNLNRVYQALGKYCLADGRSAGRRLGGRARRGSVSSGLQRFGIGRLAAILGVSAGVAAALFALVLNVGTEPKALLYSNLDLKEAGSITQALDQAGVKYDAKGDGSTIMVPRDKVASTR
jgi:flagellar biosynthesis/type III secretory pathway M-ring protein FliF/YscJ